MTEYVKSFIIHEEGVDIIRLTKKHFILILLNSIGLICIVLGFLLGRQREFIERYYSKGIYPVVERILATMSRQVPFTLMERFVIIMAIIIVISVIATVYYGIKGPRKRSVTIGLLLLLLLIYNILFYQLLWGLNNYRIPIEDQFGLEQGAIQEETLADTYNYMVESANRYGELVHGAGLLEAMTFESMAKESTKGYVQLEKEGFIKALPSTPVKPLLISPWMTSSGYTGIYLYLFSEPSINQDIPMSMMPFTAMHELAHQQGYASESDANFMGFMSCVYHPNIVFKYSAYLSGMTYVGNALYRTDPERFIALQEQQNTYVTEDIHNKQVFWEKHVIERNERIQNNLNDRFLKANNQPDGVANYSNVTQLLVKAYQKGLLPLNE